MSIPQHSERRYLGLVVGLGIAALALVMLARAVDWRSALQIISQVKPGWLALGILALLINNLAKAMRWRLLFPEERNMPGRGEAFGALMAGQLLNFTLPFRSGDIARAYFMGRHRGDSSAAAAGTIGAEKLLDLLVLGGLFTLVMPFFIFPGWVEANKTAIWAISLLALGIWIGVIAALPASQALLARLARRWPALVWPAGVAGRLLDGFSALRNRRRMLPIFLWTTAVWIGSITATYILLLSLSLPASWSLAILANVIVQGGLSVPVAPAGIGIFEWLAILALSIGGIPTDQGLAYGIVTHVAVLFFPVVVGIPWLLTRMR